METDHPSTRVVETGLNKSCVTDYRQQLSGCCKLFRMPSVEQTFSDDDFLIFWCFVTVAMLVLMWQVLFRMIDSSVCMNEAKARHVDSAIAADFKGCCNDSALVCIHYHMFP